MAEFFNNFQMPEIDAILIKMPKQIRKNKYYHKYFLFFFNQNQKKLFRDFRNILDVQNIFTKYKNIQAFIKDLNPRFNFMNQRFQLSRLLSQKDREFQQIITQLQQKKIQSENNLLFIDFQFGEFCLKANFQDQVKFLL